MTDPWVTEAAKRDAEKKVTDARARVNATGSVMTVVSEMNRVALAELHSLEDALRAITEQGLTDGYGKYSGLEQEAREERYAGKSAAIDYVKANPTCTEADAIEQYRLAALPARPADRQYLLLDPAGLLQEYRKNAVQLYVEGKLPAGVVVEDTWESFRDFLASMPKEDLLGMDVT